MDLLPMNRYWLYRRDDGQAEMTATRDDDYSVDEILIYVRYLLFLANFNSKQNKTPTLTNDR